MGILIYDKMHIPGAAVSSNKVEYFCASAHGGTLFWHLIINCIESKHSQSKVNSEPDKELFRLFYDIPSGTTPVTVCTHKLTDGQSNLCKHLHMNMYHLD